jgi:catechol 2,3-dioxygenase-like lactoylglutathione lyase family enzyme
MIDHVSLRVTDLARARAFYLKALAPLGYSVLMEFPEAIGMGADKKPDLWITQVGATTAVHLAFLAKDRAMVDAFHAAALAAGGQDFGPPGPRPQYHAGYYGAFVLDADGHNIEACVHRPE